MNNVSILSIYAWYIYIYFINIHKIINKKIFNSYNVHGSRNRFYVEIQIQNDVKLSENLQGFCCFLGLVRKHFLFVFIFVIEISICFFLLSKF